MRIDLLNLRSLDTSASLKSAGILLPARIWTISPGTSADAGMACQFPSRRTVTSEGSIPEIEAMTRLVLQSYG